MDIFAELSRLASDAYNDAREGENRAVAIESAYCTIADDIEDGIYSREDFSQHKYVAEFVLDGYGYSLSDYGINA